MDCCKEIIEYFYFISIVLTHLKIYSLIVKVVSK